MSTMQELFDRLDGLGTLGTLKMGNMPESPDEVGCLYQYPGAPPIRRFGVSGIGYEHSAFQLIFRGLPYDFTTPNSRAHIAWQNVAEIQAVNLGSTEYLQVDPQQSPGQIQPIDLNKRYRIGFNFYVLKAPSA